MSVRGRRSNVFTIPPGLPFLKTLAEKLSRLVAVRLVDDPFHRNARIDDLHPESSAVIFVS